MDNKEQLTIKHLAPYLPYGLQFKDPYASIPRYELTINNIGLMLEGHAVAWKPILRPLSDLTKEIEVNGERFVPMLKLLEMHQNMGLLHATAQYKVLEVKTFESKYDEGHREFIVQYLEEYTNMDAAVIEFVYSERFIRFAGRQVTPFPRPQSIGYQLQMFQKMYEWHFAIDIPENLYININTLTSQ